MFVCLPLQISEQAGSEEGQAEEQSEFTVKLMGFADGSKAKVIKEIKVIMEGMNLVQVLVLIPSHI